MSASLKDKLNTLPHLPGIYQMQNASGTVIYVGKARDLQKRVSSYFRKNLDSVKTERLMSQVTNFEVTITDSENQALLLESNLIKQLKPRYNVLLRDDKSYPYLFVSTAHTFPRMDFHRGTKRQTGRYFGPYPNAGAVRENLAMLQKLFQLRQCNDTFFANRTRPCLQYQIKRCTAPCVGKVTDADYAQQVEHTLLFLEGKSTKVTDALHDKMEDASREKAYEQAAQYRDKIIRIRKLQTKQYITGDKGDVDVIGFAQKLSHVAVTILFIRSGRMIGSRNFFPSVPPNTEAKNVLSAFITQYYLSPMRGDHIVDRIVLGEHLDDRIWIQDVLHDHWDKKVTIASRHIERYKRWQMVANKNARFALAQYVSDQQDVRAKLEALQSSLRLPNPVARIECFDISHTMGEATVASCVVYGEEGPLNKDYRRFNIKNITPGDDYAAMKQALMRRYTRLKTSGDALPDVLIIDGGKGQLRQAVDVMEELQVSGVILIGIAKGEKRKAGLEKLFIWGRDKPIQLATDNIAFHLLQFIRDEAHRFAITGHRAKRGKAKTESILEQVEGVGPSRRRALLKHFGGLQALRKAGAMDIAAVPGVSQSLAQKIYDALR